MSATPLERVFSQSVYCVVCVLRVGRVVTSLRSPRQVHRPRLPQPPAAASVQIHLCGGTVGDGRGPREVYGHDLGHKNIESVLDLIPLVAVTDAKDVFDKSTSDTPSYGSQKSLAFTITWIRGLLARCNVAIKWTATENMFIDCGTKEMESSHMRETLSKEEWSFRYDPDEGECQGRPGGRHGGGSEVRRPCALLSPRALHTKGMASPFRCLTAPRATDGRNSALILETFP